MHDNHMPPLTLSVLFIISVAMTLLHLEIQLDTIVLICVPVFVVRGGTERGIVMRLCALKFALP